MVRITQPSAIQPIDWARRVAAIGLVQLLVPVLGLGLGVIGCGKPAPPGIHVTGAITIDKQPIEKGTISFVPAQGSALSAEIVQGQYAIDVPAGPARVMFQATRETGRKVKMYDVEQPEVVNLVPPAYQAGVEVVIAADQAQVDFHLQSR